MWKKNELFKDLTNQQIQKLSKLVEIVTFPKDSLLIKEGDKANDFYLILEGEVNVFKEHKDFNLVTLSNGAVIGLMALIDGKPREASIKANIDTTVAKLSLKKIHDLELKIYNKIIFNHLKTQQDLLRVSNKNYILKLKERIQILQEKEVFLKLFIGGISLMGFYVICMRLTLDYIKEGTTTTFITSGMLLVIMLMGIIYIKCSPYPRSVYGLSLKNWRADIRESLVWTAIFIFIVMLLKWLYLQYIPLGNSNAILEFPIIKKNTGAMAVLIIVIYSVFCFAQEFLTRGILQSSLHQALSGRFANLRAVVFTTIMFSVLHMNLPKITYSLLVIIPGLFWGAMFAKQRTLVGVTISHILIGFWIGSIMGLPGMS